MSRLDLVIFGATGFTGKHVVAEMISMVKDYPGMTWGVAGRSKDKLQVLMTELAAKTGEDLSNVKIIVADVEDPKSLNSMCEQVKVIVNCCGPYRFLGEPVVKAAIQNKAHYVDVCGEPQFMETMQLEYNAAARNAGVYVISACGFDSIPADMGVVFLQKNFQGTLNSVKAYFTMELPPDMWPQVKKHGIVHYATWESLVYGLRHKAELSVLRKKLYPTPLPVFKQRSKLERFIHRAEDGSWCLPLMTADASVVYRSTRSSYESAGLRPPHFRAFLKLGLQQTALLLWAGLLIYLLSMFDATVRLLLNYPRLFSMYAVSHDGPTEAVAAATRFSVELRGEGWPPGDNLDELDEPPTKRMVAMVKGTNPGYGATVVAVLLSAITILKEQHLMPPSGGVMTTGTAFRNTNLIENLHKHNLTFDIYDVNSPVM